MPDDFEILPRRVEHLDHVRIGHQLEKGRHIKAIGKRVDGDRPLLAGELDHADLRPEGGLPQEFGIDGDVSEFREGLANGRQFAGICDKAHEIFIIQGFRGG